MADLEEARDKVRWGRAKKSRVVDEKEREITAYPRGRPRPRPVAARRTPTRCTRSASSPAARWAAPRSPCPRRTAHVHAAVLRRPAAGLLRRPDRGGDVLRRYLQRRPVRHRAGHEDRQADGPELGHERQARPDQLRVRTQAMRDLSFMQPEREYSEKTAEAIDAEVKQIMGDAYQNAKQTDRNEQGASWSESPMPCSNTRRWMPTMSNTFSTAANWTSPRSGTCWRPNRPSVRMPKTERKEGTEAAGQLTASSWCLPGMIE